VPLLFTNTIHAPIEVCYNEARVLFKEARLMTIVVKSSDENTISLPERLLNELKLREGDEVKAIRDGATLRLARLDTFLALRGVLADDDAFDKAIQLLDESWQSWLPQNSA
jgi:hypothetical protein